MMELELGLALPNHQITRPTMMVKAGLDLNCAYNKDKHHWNIPHDPRFNDHNEDGSDHEAESKDLSLLLWSGQPNEEDDDHKWTNLRINDDMMNEEEESGIVGWPPINSLRKELLHRNHGGWMANDHRVNNIPPARRNNNDSKYVKVKMEGMPIGRKIDLSLYHSYQSLTDAFIHMFSKFIHTKNENRDGDYRILYQDKEGDWMLAADVPWERFVESVRRVEIIQRRDN